MGGEDGGEEEAKTVVRNVPMALQYLVRQSDKTG